MASHHPVLREQPPQLPIQFGSDDLPPPPPPARDAPSAPISNFDHPLPPVPLPEDSSHQLTESISADRSNHRHPSPQRIDTQMADLYRPAEKPLPTVQSSPQMNEFHQPAEGFSSASEHGHPAPSKGSRPNSGAPSKGSRSNSRAPAGGNRPGSANSGNESDGSAGKGRTRMSWLPGSRSRSRHPSQEVAAGKQAWITQGDSITEYNMGLLQSGGKVPELWVEEGDTFVYLFPESTARPASFKIPSHILSASRPLLEMMESHAYTGGYGRTQSYGGRTQLEAADASRIYGIQALNTPPITPNTYSADNERGYDDDVSPMSPESPPLRADMHLYFPTGIMTLGSEMEPADIQRLYDVRNLFAFLLQRPLVMTTHRNNLFKVLFAVAKLLKEFTFTNFDGSTLGDAVAMSFDGYVYQRESKLLDIRSSREKTLELLVLAEAMKSAKFYNEAFTHAVGKFDSSHFEKYPVYGQVSHMTQNKLSLALIELNKRQDAVAHRLTTFDFPSVFTGIADSTSREDAKNVRFRQWKMAFLSMRKWMLEYLKDVHGSWPPKASHKKNFGSEGGLNRVVLQMLYNDLCQLYALLVDRNSFTTRSEESDDRGDGHTSVEHKALRTLLSEYDHSSPPVQPPIPFDVPLVPTIQTINVSYPRLTSKEKFHESFRKLSASETALIMNKSYNEEFRANQSSNPLVKEFLLHESKQSEGKTTQELADMRYGTWIFLYAVIQALPLLVIDADGVECTSGVEYFLCQQSVGSPPWMEGLGVPSWYGVNGNMVAMPSHSVEKSTDAIYRRSYCWVVAQKWIGNESETTSIRPSLTDPDLNSVLSPLQPPSGFSGGFSQRPQSRGRSRDDGSDRDTNNFSNLNLGSPSRKNVSSDQATAERQAARSRNRKSLANGLEKLPFTGNYDPRISHQNTPSFSGGGGPMSGNGNFSASNISGVQNSGGGQHSEQYSTKGGHPYPNSRNTSEGSETHPVGHERSVSGQGGGGWRPPVVSAPQGGNRPPSSGAGAAGTATGGTGASGGATFEDILANMSGQLNGEAAKPKKLGKKKK